MFIQGKPTALKALLNVVRSLDTKGTNSPNGNTPESITVYVDAPEDEGGTDSTSDFPYLSDHDSKSYVMRIPLVFVDLA